MEQEQWHVRVGAGRDVRHRADAADPRVELAQVQLAGAGVDEVVDLEEADVALGGEPVTQPPGEVPRLLLLRARQRRRVVVAGPAAAVRRELGVAGDVVHQRPDERAVPGQHRLDGDRAVVDPAHHLEVLARQRLLRGAGRPVRLVPDEKGGLPRVAVGHLHDQVVAQPGPLREGRQLLVGRRPAQHVRHARHAGLVAEPGRDDLGVEAVPELGGRMGDPEPGARRQRLGLLVEHDEHRPAAGAVFAHPVPDLAMPQQVIADVLDRLELRCPAVGGHEDVGMAALERVEVGDVVEVADPAVDPQQVERRR